MSGILSTVTLEAMRAAFEILPECPKARDIRVGATISKSGYIFSSTNFRPAPLQLALSEGQRVGSSSATVHAEAASLLNFRQSTEDADLHCTDPLCPNCMKNAAEAGIAHVYIDERGFEKDFYRRRGDEFENLALGIARSANMNVTVIDTESGTRLSVVESKFPSRKPAGIFIKKLPSAGMDAEIMSYIQKLESRERRACGIAKDKHGKRIFIAAVPREFAPEKGSLKEAFEANSQYNSILEPLDRILMICARYGYKIQGGDLWSSIVPTGREQINLIAAGINKIHIGNPDRSLRECGHTAMRTLQEAGVLIYAPAKLEHFVGRNLCPDILRA